MIEKSIRILLVERIPADCRFCREIYHSAAKCLSEDALIEFRSPGHLSEGSLSSNENGYDLILLDVGSPDAEAIEMIKDVAGRAPGIPIVTLSQSEGNDFAAKALSHGAHDHLIKGQLDPQSLGRAMRYAIERQQMVRKLEASRKWEHHLAYHDTLTNLPNRALFYDRLEQAIAHSKRNGQSVAVLFIDLDEFKRINDALGHSKGDILLQIASRKLKRCIRESDTVARLGGDEFTVVLEKMDRPSDAVQVAKKILERLSAPFSIGGIEVCITGSIGISLFPSDATDVESLVKYADLAMYRAKAKGKNNYHLFDPSIDIPDHKRLSMAEALRHAVESNEFVVHYQPQVNLTTGDITGCEALLRWKSPSLGLIPPAEFIPLAEETDIIIQIGKWLLRTVCDQSRAWQLRGLKPTKVAINLSARQFSARGLIQDISQSLAISELEPKYLELEITESCAMQDLDYTIATLKALKEKGLQLTVDDFGTGYSSMGNLKSYPVDTLKIDRSFVRNLPEDRDNAAITTAIIAMAHSLGKKTIAEGVETEQQASFLRSINCDEMQGYFFSRPIPSDAMEKLLVARNSTPEIIECSKI